MNRPARVLLGVTGGIAAYKAADLASRMRQRGMRVSAVLTPRACEFIAPLTFAALTGRQTYVDQDLLARGGRIAHIELAKSELAIVAPATADFLAHLRSGLASNLLLTALLAMPPQRVLLAPAMESQMWAHPSTQENVAWLRGAGYRVIEPESGHLSSGAEGVGRLPDPAWLLELVESALTPQDLAGRHILISGGPTVEPIDDVRYLSNPSSGKMAVALAQVALRRGARASLVYGPAPAVPPRSAAVVPVRTALEMRDAVLSLLPSADAVVLAAAVADFRPAQATAGKPAKSDVSAVVELVANPDIAAEVGRRKRPDQILVAFAAEIGDAELKADVKRRRKGADLIVANEVGGPEGAFGRDDDAVWLLGDELRLELPRMPKVAVAGRVLDQVRDLWR